MNCAAWQEKIALSLYGELTQVETAELVAHCDTCTACRAEREAFAGTVALLRRSSLPIPGTIADKPVAQPGRKRWIAAAALLAASVALALGVRAWKRPNVKAPQPPGPIAKVRPPVLPADRVSLALESGTEADFASIVPLSVEAEDALARAAIGENSAHALRAIEWLGAAGSRRTEPALRAALVPRVTRLAAFQALRAHGRLDLTADVAPALRDLALRREAADILVKTRGAKAFEMLLTEAVAGNDVAEAACRSFPASVALPALTQALAVPKRRATANGLFLTTDGDEIRGALATLCTADSGLLAASLSRAVPNITDQRCARFIVLALGNTALSEAAVAAVKDIPVAKLRAGLEIGLRDPKLRPELVSFLIARAKELPARDLLVAALDSAEARPAAARAMLEQGDTRPVKALLESASPEDILSFQTLPAATRRHELERALRSAKLRPGALRAVTGDDLALWPQIVPLLREQSVREEAAGALARAGASGAIPYLIPWVSPEGDGARVHNALVSLAGVDPGTKSEQWSRWWTTRRRD